MGFVEFWGLSRVMSKLRVADEREIEACLGRLCKCTGIYVTCKIKFKIVNPNNQLLMHRSLTLSNSHQLQIKATK